MKNYLDALSVYLFCCYRWDQWHFLRSVLSNLKYSDQLGDIRKVLDTVQLCNYRTRPNPPQCSTVSAILSDNEDLRIRTQYVHFGLQSLGCSFCSNLQFICEMCKYFLVCSKTEEKKICKLSLPSIQVWQWDYIFIHISRKYWMVIII